VPLEIAIVLPHYGKLLRLHSRQKIKERRGITKSVYGTNS
jgi:hypothetical protein